MDAGVSDGVCVVPYTNHSSLIRASICIYEHFNNKTHSTRGLEFFHPITSKVAGCEKPPDWSVPKPRWLFHFKIFILATRSPSCIRQDRPTVDFFRCTSYLDETCLRMPLTPFVTSARSGASGFGGDSCRDRRSEETFTHASIDSLIYWLIDPSISPLNNKKKKS